MKQLKNSKQMTRFAVVGAANTILDFGILFTLRSFGIPLVVANIVSTTTAFLASFVANKKYIFKTQGTNVKREVLLFILVTLFGLWVLQSVVLWLLSPLLTQLLNSQHVVLLVGKLLATAASMIWNYVLYSLVVFKEPTNSSEQ